MPSLSIVFASLAAILHVLFFLMESLFFMNPKVYKTFGAKSGEEANILRLLYFNQGFYNLFLALGIFGGVILLNGIYAAAGKGIILFSCGNMFLASVVLLISKPKMLRGVLIQGLCPVIAILAWYFGR